MIELYEDRGNNIQYNVVGTTKHSLFILNNHPLLPPLIHTADSGVETPDNHEDTMKPLPLLLLCMKRFTSLMTIIPDGTLVLGKSH